MKSTTLKLNTAFVAVAAALCPALAAAQAYPTKIVRVIVPFAPGGGSDITARQVSAKLTEMLKQQFVVDNRGGAAGIIGMELVAKAPADGYTIMMMSGSFSATSFPASSGPPNWSRRLPPPAANRTPASIRSTLRSCSLTRSSS